MLTVSDLQKIREIIREEVSLMIKKEIDPLRREIKQIRRDINLIIAHFDKRLSTVEKHLHLSS